MKLTSILKEIIVRPSTKFNTIQQLVDYIKDFPEYRTELINAAYEAADLQQDSGWLDIKSDIINGEMDDLGDMIGLYSDYDGILISLEPVKDEIDENDSFILNGNTFYYGFA